jgi:hypothetical protein
MLLIHILLGRYESMTIRNRGKRLISRGDLVEMKGACFICLEHKTVPRKHYVNFPWKVQRIRIYSNKTAGLLILAREQNTVLKTIHCEIESHSFDPARYAKADLRKFSLDASTRFWLPGMCSIEDETAFNESQKGAEAGPCPGGPFSAFSRGVTHIHYISGGILWKT